MRGVRYYFLILIYAAFIGSMVALYYGALKPPPEWNPFIVIDLNDPKSPFTRMKLRELGADPELCHAALSVTDLRYTPHPGLTIREGCGIEDGVNVLSSDVAFNEPYWATCGLAAALYVFEREVIQEAAQRHFGQGVVEIVHSGTYSCRNVGFQKGGNRSQHARANAMDIVAFGLADGRTVRVSRKTWVSDTPEGAFLKQVHEGACRVFGTTLGPDYNKQHYTHFHVDMRPNGKCY